MAFEGENDNLARTIQRAEEFFNTRDDPEQISVTEEIMVSLRRIHPATRLLDHAQDERQSAS